MMCKSIVWLACLIASITFAADPPLRNEFFSLYYKGDYAKAHEILESAISDPITREIWEGRIHFQETIANCKSDFLPAAPAKALATLRIGKFEEASTQFADDWISLWGKAILSQWTLDYPTARNQIHKAIDLQPERPELLFFAGDLADTPEQTIDYFTRFLKIESEDPVSRNIAEMSITFLKKTAGIPLNILSVESGIKEIKCDYDPRTGLKIRGVVDSREKMDLMLDTGAGSGLILENREWRPQVFTEVVMLGLGKKQITKSKRIVLNHFQVEKFAIKNPVATQAESLPSADLNGLIGTAIFASHRILLPVRTGRDVVLLPYDQDPNEYFTAKKIKFKTRETFPFYSVNKLIILKGRIRKSPADMDILLDTGSDSSLISVAAAKKFGNINYPLSMQLRRQATVSGVGGKSDHLLIAENVEVGLGSISRNFNQMLCMNFAETGEALGLEVDLLLGRDFLQGYTLLIDYKNRQISFLK